MKLKVMHGGKEYEVTVEDDAIVSDLSKEVCALTGVPCENQRLILKGKSLTDSTQKLALLGATNGSKVMALGRKMSEEGKKKMQQMQQVEKEVESITQKMNDAKTSVRDIKNGFLQQDLQDEALKKLNRQLLGCTQAYTTQLETLDAISLASSTTDMQNKRKNIVRKIQALLSQADETLHLIVELQENKVS